MIQEEEPSVFTYLLQQVGVPLGSLLLLLVAPGFSWSFVQSGVFGQTAEVIRCLMIESLVGFWPLVRISDPFHQYGGTGLFLPRSRRRRVVGLHVRDLPSNCDGVVFLPY